MRPSGYITLDNAVNRKFDMAVKIDPACSNFQVQNLKKDTILYYAGNIELLGNKNIVSVIGTREVDGNIISRARRIGKELAKNNVVVLSGLARGVDTFAMVSAMENGGSVIGVIGTPLDKYYPPENKSLQMDIAKNHLLISQFPIGFQTHRGCFPQRNATMATLSKATVLVFTKDGGGSLWQTRHCLKTRKKIFIMESTLHDPNQKWPDEYVSRSTNDENKLVIKEIPGNNVSILSSTKQVLDFLENP